ncbi:hypothetical protein NZ47_02850 [Anaerovibrio lipolyticus]|uniref:Uncharacterized protein n=1 Tax=Anaerovibrio lipolyticus TaxID=82374 RepID=A0A0B2K211_9FIRM|nr:hypothetical protein [Anaerovibrio lipolyticus]KHM52791.1 hypothetical protein NZ47_02850 [Anaerovibrio lipolyticus]
MTVKELKKFLVDYAFNFKKYISLSVTVLITFVLIFGVIASTSYVYSSYSKAKETETKISDMHNFLHDWQIKVDKLNGSEFRPVTEKDLDDIQATLLFNLQTNNLKLNSFKSLTPVKSGASKDKTPENAEKKDSKKADEQKQKKKEQQNSKHDFEMEFEGEYANVMQFLSHFKAKNALINIQSVELKSKKGVIIAQLKYRAYTI